MDKDAFVVIVGLDGGVPIVKMERGAASGMYAKWLRDLKDDKNIHDAVCIGLKKGAEIATAVEKMWAYWEAIKKQPNGYYPEGMDIPNDKSDNSEKGIDSI